MKCLSVSQPFADLIVSGKKTVELRSWNTKFRGEFMVHAPLKVRANDCRRLEIDCSELVTGAIIGKAHLSDVKRYASASQIRADQERHHAASRMCSMAKRWYGFELCSPVRFRAPVACKGKLGFFEVRDPASDPTRESIISDILNDEHMYRLVGHH